MDTLGKGFWIKNFLHLYRNFSIGISLKCVLLLKTKIKVKKTLLVSKNITELHTHTESSVETWYCNWFSKEKNPFTETCKSEIKLKEMHCYLIFCSLQKLEEEILNSPLSITVRDILYDFKTWNNSTSRQLLHFGKLDFST